LTAKRGGNVRGLHLLIGLLALLAFLITGQFIRHHQPPTPQLDDALRLLLRSRHIYILASALVNLMLGLYLESKPGWRGVTQAAGSCMAMASPLFLILAFAAEPAQGFQPEMFRSSAGLYLLFLGSMLHLITGSRSKEAA
jgi:hypothetical protein